MELIREEELLRAAAEKGVIAKRCTAPDPKNTAIIDGTVEDLLEIAAMRKSVLLYSYAFPDPGMYIIDNETIEAAGDSISQQLSDYEFDDILSDKLLGALYGKVHFEDLEPYERKDLQADLKKLNPIEKTILDECLAYNGNVDADILKTPTGLIAFVPVDGFAVTVFTQADSVHDNPAAEAAEKIIEAHLDELISSTAEAISKKEEQEAKLRLMLLKDKAFLACTNKNLRTRHAEKLWKANKWIRDLFNPEGFHVSITEPNGRCISFVESVWAEYRLDKTIVDKLD